MLEALAGTVTPLVAADTLGISTPKYYVESRALEGLIAACEPKPRGHTKTPERELAKLSREYAKLERECVRYQALARAAQRTLGVVLPKGKEDKPEKGKRKRKPVVRALRVAEALREDKTEMGARDVETAERAGTGAGPLRLQRGEEKAGGDTGNDSREEGNIRGATISYITPPASCKMLPQFLYLLLDFFRPLVVELLFIRCKMAQQPEEFASVHTLLVGHVFQHFYSQFVVR